MEHKEHLKNRPVRWEELHCFWHHSLGSEEQLGHRSSSAGTAGPCAPACEAGTTCTVRGAAVSLKKEHAYSSCRQQRTAQDAAQRPVNTCGPHGAHWKPRGICRRDNWAFMVLALLSLEVQSLPPYSNARALHLGYTGSPWLSAVGHQATRSTRACCCQLSFEGS